MYALFPNKDINNLERIVFSIGFSIAVVSLLGLLLNYTAWGIRLVPILLCLELFIFCLGTIAIFRWRRTPAENRYYLPTNVSLPNNEDKLDKTLTVIVVLSVIIVACISIYVIMTPKEGEIFTEFYLLSSNNNTQNYPTNLTIAENTSIIIGLLNHEYKTINYTIEIWLSNQTEEYNSTSEKNETSYHNLWFMDKIMVTLDHQPIDLEEKWLRQWEHNYTFNITEKGTFKLAFLLYTSQTPDYFRNYDYKMIAYQKISSENTTAYRTTHLWITVK